MIHTKRYFTGLSWAPPGALHAEPRTQGPAISLWRSTSIPIPRVTCSSQNLDSISFLHYMSRSQGPACGTHRVSSPDEKTVYQKCQTQCANCPSREIRSCPLLNISDGLLSILLYGHTGIQRFIVWVVFLPNFTLNVFFSKSNLLKPASVHPHSKENICDIYL